MPHQGRQVVEDDGETDVVDRSVARRLDDPVGDRPPTEEPQVPGACLRDGPVEADGGAAEDRHPPSLPTPGLARLGDMPPSNRLWKVTGIAGLIGVVATGVLIVRNERQRRAYTPEEVRERLHRRLRAAEEADVAH